MHCTSPRAKGGFSILAASKLPPAFPAPTIVWISSINRITFLFFINSFNIAFKRSSNCPRYFVPATTEAMSNATTRFPNNTGDTFFCTIRIANPSTMADLPTPGSPISTGLFFFRRLKICIRRSISRSLPTIGSNVPSSAAFVISVPYVSNSDTLDFTGVRRRKGLKNISSSSEKSKSFDSSPESDCIRVFSFISRSLKLS